MNDDFRWIRATTRREWLEQRHQYIGASEAAAIVGVSKFSSPSGVWYRKTGPVEDNEQTIQQEVGHELEPLIARLFTRETGVEVSDPGDYAIAVSNRYPWLSCTLDRFAEPVIPVELKTASFDAAKEWKERVPLAYQIQVMIQMIVTGSRQGYIAVLLNGSAFKWHPVAYHERLAERLIVRTKDFYERCMVGGERPAPDGHDATRQVLSSLYPKADGDPLDLPGELADLGAEYDELAAQMKAAKERQQQIQNSVKDALGPAPLGRLSDGSGFRWSGDKSRRFTRVKKVKVDE